MLYKSARKLQTQQQTCMDHSTMSTTIKLELILPLLTLLLRGYGTDGQQFIYARDERSLYEAPPVGWNSVGGFNPFTLGHMSKDELLTLLEAWQEVEESTKTPIAEPAEPTATAAPTPAPAPAPPPPPPPPPPPLPTTPLLPPRPPPPPPGPPAVPGAPVNVRLPAFVPIQLTAMYTPGVRPVAVPAGAGLGPTLPAGLSPAVGGAPAVIDNGEAPDLVEEASPLFFQPTLRAARARGSHQLKQHVMRNTLESVDADLAPLANLVQAKAKSGSAPILVKPRPKTLQQTLPNRHRFALPPSFPFYPNAPGPLELVPSSQIIGDWRE